MVMVACLIGGGAAFAQTATGSEADTDTLFVARRGWHIDVGFRVGELAQPMSLLGGEFPGASYVFFGFGDRRYLMARNRATPLMLLALIPGRGLILGTGLRAAPDAAFGRSEVMTLSVPRDGALRAQAFVWEALTDAQQSLLRLRDTSHRGPVGIPGPYEGSSFFESRARYSAVHTCNTWAAEVLSQAGVPLRSGHIIVAGQLWRQLERIQATQLQATQPPLASLR